MKTPQTGTLLRIFIGSSDEWHGKPLFEALVLRAREMHIAGASVLRGVIGYGKHSRIHAAHLESLSTDLPIVVEIVDTEETIRAFLPIVDEMVDEGLVTMEKVNVIKYAAPTT